METMPVWFIGHGSPMNAVEDTHFDRAWATVAQTLPKPKAISCVSALWVTPGARLTAMEQPKTIFSVSLFHFLSLRGELTLPVEPLRHAHEAASFPRSEVRFGSRSWPLPEGGNCGFRYTNGFQYTNPHNQ